MPGFRSTPRTGSTRTGSARTGRIAGTRTGRKTSRPKPKPRRVPSYKAAVRKRRGR